MSSTAGREQRLDRLAIFAATSSDGKDFNLGCASSKVGLPLGDEHCVVHPFQFFNGRDKGACDD